MESAMHAVREGRMSCNMATTIFEIPVATLRRYLNIDPELDELSSHLTEIGQRIFGLTKIQCRKLIFQFADACGLNHPLKKTIKMAGEDWVSSFMKAYNFSMRAPEVTSIGRTISLNPAQVGKLFDLLMDVLRYLMLTNRAGRQSPPNYLRLFHQRAQICLQREENVTVVCSVSVTGVSVPPFLIFSRK
ncbi:hypothetical protein PR048_028443 [Dryococelus australis]|uniref:HTH psq-type domain-containing protein n=1 Tax=Dryococelus australis TaxID=614101 RepID=A0ABQ9GAL2_9NEOP|nr:hypothetical protein PR048_028443 [Dryococelus australis]